MAVKSVSIRIEEEMLQKIAYVADYEGRSINSHILVLVRNSIKRFEEDNGKIELEQPIDNSENVKPAGKGKN
ncbi:MAG: Arc family DNA-binding protein [Ruminococcus sp.]|nr:Arc family DNA-binding protein [Ruminococcus sp.]MCM1478168.1 Arc family DNA-binding protein [Muribaculaceae bacterium]